MTNAKKVDTRLIYKAARDIEKFGVQPENGLYDFLTKVGVFKQYSDFVTYQFEKLFGGFASQMPALEERVIFLTFVACYYRDLQNEH